MAALKNNYLVEKRNVLNEMRANANGMTLQETRFFLIYGLGVRRSKTGVN